MPELGLKSKLLASEHRAYVRVSIFLLVEKFFSKTFLEPYDTEQIKAKLHGMGGVKFLSPDWPSPGSLWSPRHLTDHLPQVGR